MCASFNEADAMNTNRKAVPHISMSRDARYVTQSNVWGSHILGPFDRPCHRTLPGLDKTQTLNRDQA